jgi:hypothetical protein
MAREAVFPLDGVRDGPQSAGQRTGIVTTLVHEPAFILGTPVS